VKRNHGNLSPGTHIIQPEIGTPGSFSVPGSRFLVLGSQFSALGSQFSVLGSRLSVLSSWFLVLGSQFSVLGSRFSVLGSQFSVLSREHPMKRLFLLLLIISAYAIAACSAPATTAPIVADSAPSGNVNIDNLPLNVDVATVRALQGRDDVILIDVREPEEYAAGHIPGVHLIPMGEVPSRLNEIPTDKTVIVTCRSGNRSGQITDFLRRNGFTRVHNMQGGLLAWQEAGYPVEK
jgi:phage shock protein E